MDKEQIVNTIKSNPNLSFEEIKKQALEAGMTAELFEEAWNEAKGGASEPVASTPPAEADLEKKSVIGMIILTIITLGIYIPIWLFKRREKLNSLNSKMKAGKTVIFIILVLQIIGIIIIFAPFFLTHENLSDVSMTFKKFENYQSWVSFFAALAVLKASFDIRSIIRDHFNTQLSGAGTFFFTIFYLQYKINQLTQSETA